LVSEVILFSQDIHCTALPLTVNTLCSQIHIYHSLFIVSIHSIHIITNLCNKKAMLSQGNYVMQLVFANIKMTLRMLFTNLFTFVA